MGNFNLDTDEQKEWYSISTNRSSEHLGDCLELMPLIADESIDMNTNDELKNETANGTKPVLVAGASEKPKKEKYGWHEQCGFDDEPSGWMFEGGEEAYYQALKKWEDANGTCH